MSDITREGQIESTHLVEEGDGVGLPALLPADAVLDPALDGLGAVDRHLDELAHALWWFICGLFVVGRQKVEMCDLSNCLCIVA